MTPPENWEEQCALHWLEAIDVQPTEERVRVLGKEILSLARDHYADGRHDGIREASDQ